MEKSCDFIYILVTNEKREQGWAKVRGLDQYIWGLEMTSPTSSFKRLSLLDDLVARVVDGTADTCAINVPNGVREVDLVISGGGLRGYFVTGASVVLHNILKREDIKVARYAGASCGAWCAAFIAMGMSTRTWVETFLLTQKVCSENPKKTIHTAYRDTVIPWLYRSKGIPDDAYKRCSGRCFISITRLTPLPVNEIVSEFKDNNDLLNCLMGSSAIPYFTESSLTGFFRGRRVLDGGITNNLPLFFDNSDRHQFVIRLSDVPITWTNMITPSEQCIETMVLRGALQISDFFLRRKGHRPDSDYERDQKAFKKGIFHWYLNKKQPEPEDDAEILYEDHGLLLLRKHHVVRTLLSVCWIFVYQLFHFIFSCCCCKNS